MHKFQRYKVRIKSSPNNSHQRIELKRGSVLEYTFDYDIDNSGNTQLYLNTLSNKKNPAHNKLPIRWVLYELRESSRCFEKIKSYNYPVDHISFHPSDYRNDFGKRRTRVRWDQKGVETLELSFLPKIEEIRPFCTFSKFKNNIFTRIFLVQKCDLDQYRKIYMDAYNDTLKELSSTCELEGSLFYDQDYINELVDQLVLYPFDKNDVFLEKVKHKVTNDWVREYKKENTKKVNQRLSVCQLFEITPDFSILISQSIDKEVLKEWKDWYSSDNLNFVHIGDKKSGESEIGTKSLVGWF